MTKLSNAEEEVVRLSEENYIFRRLLFATHISHGVYGDDGELQCSGCLIDFKRDPAISIEGRINEMGIRKLIAEQKKLPEGIRLGTQEWLAWRKAQIWILLGCDCGNRDSLPAPINHLPPCSNQCGRTMHVLGVE